MFFFPMHFPFKVNLLFVTFSLYIFLIYGLYLNFWIYNFNKFLLVIYFISHIANLHFKTCAFKSALNAILTPIDHTIHSILLHANFRFFLFHFANSLSLLSFWQVSTCYWSVFITVLAFHLICMYTKNSYKRIDQFLSPGTLSGLILKVGN